MDPTLLFPPLPLSPPPQLDCNLIRLFYNPILTAERTRGPIFSNENFILLGTLIPRFMEYPGPERFFLDQLIDNVCFRNEFIRELERYAHNGFQEFYVCGPFSSPIVYHFGMGSEKFSQQMERHLLLDLWRPEVRESPMTFEAVMT